MERGGGGGGGYNINFHQVLVSKNVSVANGPLTSTEFLINERSAVCHVNTSQIFLFFFKSSKKCSQLILLIFSLASVHDFSQLANELCQRLHVVVRPLQKLIAEAGDVLFDLLQFTCKSNKSSCNSVIRKALHPQNLLNSPSLISSLCLSLWAFRMNLLMRRFIIFCD